MFDISILLQTMTWPGLVNIAGFILFFGGLALLGAWLSHLTR
jgi:hypothetical protein